MYVCRSYRYHWASSHWQWHLQGFAFKFKVQRWQLQRLVDAALAAAASS
jgi:hypothetical protein